MLSYPLITFCNVGEEYQPKSLTEKQKVEFDREERERSIRLVIAKQQGIKKEIK